MRCPKCGSFLEDDRDVCFMCGVNVKTYNPGTENANNVNSFNNDSSFSTGFNNEGSRMKQNTVTGSGLPQSYYDRAKSKENPSKKHKDSDFIDFYQSHKGLVGLLAFGIVLLIVILIGVNYYKRATAPKVNEPIVGDLYYVVPDKFDDVSTNNTHVYTLSGSKGSDCSITVSYMATTSEDYVSNYFDDVTERLQPQLNSNGEVEDKMLIFKSQRGEASINGNKWYYLNVFYRKDEKATDYSLLKYKHMANVYKGYSYTIILTNNANNSVCNTSLDSFANSLEFIEK